LERDAAFARFERTGLPTRRVEQWKYTDLRALMRDAKPLAPAPDKAAIERAKSAGSILPGVIAHRLVFVDGTFVPELSEQATFPGLRIYSLASEIERRADDPREVVLIAGGEILTAEQSVASHALRRPRPSKFQSSRFET
jgi:Fe-S cluster assembly protein SufD